MLIFADSNCIHRKTNMKPLIGITMGDPSGIGPEIIIKALQEEVVYQKCRPLVVGDAGVMEQTANKMGLTCAIHEVSEVSEAIFKPRTLDVLHLDCFKGDLQTGQVSAASGEAAFRSIVAVIEMALAGELDATVTAPINKESIHLAGHHFSGHTEIYAHYTNTRKYAMLLVHENLRVIHTTTHVSLREACDLVKKERILEVIDLLHQACLNLDIPDPRIAVAGLNPHSSDNGLFGWEEEREIIPAIEEASESGFSVEGPVPPDTVFAKAIAGRYDGCVAMYHDQGHIPFKMAGFTWNQEKGRMDVSGVNITLGLPIIRVSVDHGTAFDVAGKGIASEAAMSLSIDYAVRMAKAQHKKK
jgi:4-hydroxythreonine-4-phosphate dehydrogenase